MACAEWEEVGGQKFADKARGLEIIGVRPPRAPRPFLRGRIHNLIEKRE